MILLAALLLAAQTPTQPQAVARTELQRHDLSIPGREAVQVRVDFSPGATVPRHRHPGEELVLVLRGCLHVRIEAGSPVILCAPDTHFIAAGAVHEARAGERGASILATYIVEKGRPLLTPVP